MGKDMLLLKSEENYKTGEWAENKKYFDAAISRYYYCAYEKLIYISKKKGFYKETKEAKNSHYNTITEFNRNLKDKLTTDEKMELNKMKQLRRVRNDAEYGETKLQCNNEFHLIFKYYFNNINCILDKLI